MASRQRRRSHSAKSGSSEVGRAARGALDLAAVGEQALEGVLERRAGDAVFASATRVPVGAAPSASAMQTMRSTRG